MKPLQENDQRTTKERKEGLPWQTISTNSKQNLVEGIEFVLLPGLPHDCVTFTPPGSAYPRQSPPFVQPKPSLDLRCGFLAAFVAQASDCSCGANSFSLINRSSAALSCGTNNTPRSSGDIFSAQGAFSLSLFPRRTTTLGGDGDPEIIDKFSSPTKKSHQSWKGTVALENRKCPLV